MSKIEVDAIEPQSGTTLTIGASGDTITIPSGATLTNSGTATGFGKVLQVVSTTKTDTFSSSSSSFVDVTGLSVSITPSSATSKILVIAYITASAASGTDFATLRLMRDSTAICIGDSAGSRTRGLGASFQVGNNNTSYTESVNFLDSPNTTSSTAYKIQSKAAFASNAFINRTPTDSDNASTCRGASTITVMEIAG
jgi:hypothetical protein